MTVRTVLHLDLDAFFCAVEEQRDPSLRGKAFAVGGRPESRGVVASCSYPARRYGVHSAMPMARAVRQCPGLLVVPPHFKAYRAASDRVMAALGDLTPMIDQISIDEAFLDVTGTAGTGEEIARRVQAAIRDDLGLPSSLGVATNMLVSKIANNLGKANAPKGVLPNAITVVPPGQEAAYLAPLPIRELWGVGPKTAERLARLGVRTIGDLAAWPEGELVRLFGKNGADLWRHARGIDERPVEPEHEAKSISKEITFARDVDDRDTLARVLTELSEGVGLRLRRAGQSGTTVRLKLRWSDFTTLTRQETLPLPIDQDAEIVEAALRLFASHWPAGRPVRLIGVGVSGLEAAGRQMGLWEDAADAQHRRLQTALDDLRNRYGEGVIRRGTDLKRKPR